jgi:hypothetical protein
LPVLGRSGRLTSPLLSGRQEDIRRYNSNINIRKANTGDIMKRSGIILVTVALIVAMASLASFAAAVCTTCGEEDWGKSASNFLEGKPINDVPSSLSNPQQARAKNDFNSNLLKEDTVKGSNNAAQEQTLNLSLIDARAVPNPVKSGSPVMITAIFGNISSDSPDNATTLNVSAVIKNSDDMRIGKANLERTTGTEYAGIWLANVQAGVYKAAIVASTAKASKTFNDTLEIEVTEAA